MKNILFVTHHNNDFDHFLPIILELEKHKEISTNTIAFYTKEDILKNKLHHYICKTNNIHLDAMTDICYFVWVNNALTKIYKHALNTVYLTNLKNVFLNLIHFALLRYFVMCSIFFLPDRKITKYLKIKKIDLSIVDQRIIDESLIDTNLFTRFKNAVTEKTDPMNHVLFRVIKRARENNIPIIIIPHGAQPVSQNIPEIKHQQILLRIQNPFRPDFLFVCSKNDLSVQSYHYMLGEKSTLYLGDPRFDIDWINYLEKCALKVYGSTIKKPSDKIVLLYLMDIFIYSQADNTSYKLELHKDILSLVNLFPNLEVWVKHHPRKIFKLPIKDFIHADRQKNIRQFKNDIDTNILLAKADICISLNSTMLISPIVQKKPVIFYDRGKEKLKDVTTIYDNLEFIASSQEQLVKQYKKIINEEYKIDDSSILSFYKKVFSVNSLSDSMVEKYTRKIKEILGVDNSE